MKKIKVAALMLILSLLISSCSSGTDAEVFATVGEETVSVGEVAFLTAQSTENIKKQMEGMSDSEKQDYWNTDVDGKKPADVIKENAAEYLINYAVFAQACKDEGITASSSEVKARMNSAYPQDDLKKYKNTYGISTDSVKKVVRKQILYQKYVARVLEKKEDFTPDESKLTELFKNNYIKAKHILLLTTDMSTGEKYSADKIEETRKKAEDLLNKVKKGEDFDELMMENSQDPGLQSAPNGYVFTEGEMVSEFYDAAKNLEVGGISDIVETSYGFHIIKRVALLDTDMAAKKDELVSKYKNDYTDKFAEDLKTKYDVKQDDSQLNGISVNTDN